MAHDVQPAENGALSNRVAAVIVTYFPERVALRKLIEVVRPQVERIEIIDNTPVGEAPSALASLGEVDGAVSNGRNVGLAAAQNQGIARARAFAQQFVLLLDQDSLPAPDMVEHLLLACQRLVASGARVAAIGPRRRDRHSGTDAPFVRLGLGRLQKVSCLLGADRTIECDTLVASGCLIPLASLDAVGVMDEPLFIDQIDVEWGMRAHARGYRLFGACDAVLFHGIGDRVVRPWFARGRRIPVHGPLRDYYLVRNIVTVFFRRHAPWRWRLLQAIRLPGLVLVITTQMPPRVERLRMILRGVGDALRGRLGAASFRSSGA
jgi:rhamnosyltransferase